MRSTRSGSNAPPALTAQIAPRPSSRPTQREPPARAVADRVNDFAGLGEGTAPGTNGAGLEERMSPGERGRRRTRQDQISLGQEPVKLRTSGIRTERRKLVSSAGPVFVRV